jgi:ATP-dependent DNA ligase
MLDFTTLHRGDDNKFYLNSENGEVELEELFPMDEWDDPRAFNMAGIRGYEPMTAKELETEEQQDEKLADYNYILEEKFDGTRALVYFMTQTTVENKEVGFCRVFSRRISKKTGFYVENTDSVPQIREIDVPELAGTILDGEMFINGLPFKEVSSTLNCLWDKAVDRQIEKGFISLHAFDILFYHGIDLRKMPLDRRKVYLHLAIEEANSPYIEEVKYFNCARPIEGNLRDVILARFNGDEKKAKKFFGDVCGIDEDLKNTYPNLSKVCCAGSSLTPRAYYELIVATGGEGLIVKPKKGLYHHKRGWEYSKIKKFLTREMIVIGFDEPTKEYSGKDIKKWAFWVDNRTDKRVQGNFYGDRNYTAVTKFYYNKQVGNLLLGVLITDEEYNSLLPNKRGRIVETYEENVHLMEVCECAGFDDETREYFTRNKDKIVGSVVEVKANELMRDSGRMRHPRYLRMRFDKEPERCTWSDHIGDSEVTR